jgi:hypothetical protein
MWSLLTAASLALIAVVLWDAFEAVLLPRRVTRNIRFSRIYYVNSWTPWAAIARRMRAGKARNSFLSLFGPLSVIVLIGAWATGLITGFALLHWSLGTRWHAPDEPGGLGTCFYVSGTTFFTLGFGDVTPVDPLGRLLAVVEAGLGMGFLALFISYVPVLYQAFSSREVTISRLDARAGSPPSAAQLLVRLARGHRLDVLDRFLEEWERWAAEVLESHVSFPMLSYYRSQHDNQSWLAALTAALDSSAVVLSVVESSDPYQARLTFAMARHVVVDLAQVYRVPPFEPEHDRLPPERLQRLREELHAAEVVLREGAAADHKLAELRGMYEPFVAALSQYFLLALPPILPESVPVDNWQTSAWMRRTRGIGALAAADAADDHVD